MAELKVHSRREPLPRELIYPLKTSELVSALQPKLTQDAHLAVFFQRKQAHWKEQRDQMEEEGRYTLARCTYYSSGRHLWTWPNSPWSSEERPQVVQAEVLAIPRAALRKGVSLHVVTAELVREAVAVIAPQGIPSPPQRGQRPDDAWLFELELDSTVHRLRARLRPWIRGAFGSQILERELAPPAPQDLDKQPEPSEADQDPDVER